MVQTKKLRLTLIGLFFIMMSFGSWYAIKLYSTAVGVVQMAKMIDYGYVDDVKEIHQWHPELVKAALKENLSYNRSVHSIKSTQMRIRILKNNGESYCQEFTDTSEEWTVEFIRSPVILKVIENDDIEMLRFLISLNPEMDLENSKNETTLELIKSVKLARLLHPYDLYYMLTVRKGDNYNSTDQPSQVVEYLSTNF